jgi:hypothetical protein
MYDSRHSDWSFAYHPLLGFKIYHLQSSNQQYYLVRETYTTNYHLKASIPSIPSCCSYCTLSTSSPLPVPHSFSPLTLPPLFLPSLSLLSLPPDATGVEINTPKVDRDSTAPMVITVTGTADGVARATKAINELVTKGYCKLLASDDFKEGSIEVHPKYVRTKLLCMHNCS